MDKDSEENKVAKNNFVQTGTILNPGYTTTCTGSAWNLLKSKGLLLDFLQEGNALKSNNPYIPLKIYCNSLTKTTIVKWNDGTETKVTCDIEDNFSPESGYFAALVIKVFGNDKKKFKDFWYPVISRRTVVDGKKMKPVAYGKWERQRNESNKRRKNYRTTGTSVKRLSTKSGK
jgi:hypothetical protein